MPQTSSPLYDFEIVDMAKAVSVIFERPVAVGKCDCFNDVYNSHDPQCPKCKGVGTAITERTQRLGKAVMKSTGGIVDDEDPIAFAFTFDFDVTTGDVVVCGGRRYKVIEIGESKTLSNQKVLVCGLDYERDYNHNQTDLERYK